MPRHSRVLLCRGMKMIRPHPHHWIELRVGWPLEHLGLGVERSQTGPIRLDPMQKHLREEVPVDAIPH